ncbi:MAG TPA: hypothetical protein VIC26_15285 [Marinagarivorans sp.]
MEVTDLPLFCTQPETCLAMLATDEAIYVAYERERDFLSAPKAFIVCTVPADALVMVNDCHATEAQWLILEGRPHGVYRYQYDDRTFFVFYGGQQLFDVQASELEVAKEIYHCTSPYEAILKYQNKDHVL